MNDIPAFPRSIYSLNGAINSQSMSAGYGMDLSDYFAAKAMHAFISGWINRGAYPETDEVIAEHAYSMADAMMKARKK